MPVSRDTKLLSAFRQCRNAVSDAKITFRLIDDELIAVTELLKMEQITAKLKGNLESLLEHVILNTDLDWISLNLSELGDNRSLALHRLFLESPSDSTLISLISTFNKLSTGVRQELCMRLLENYFKDRRFVGLLLEESVYGTTRGVYEETISQNLLSALNSLPSKVANNTLGKFSEIFHHEQFFQLIAIQTCDVIDVLVQKVRDGKDVSVRFIAQMVGQFCFCGKADAFLGVLLPYLITKSSSDFVWRKIAQKMVSTISDRHLETAVLYIVKKLPWYGCMKWIFDDSILHNKKLKFLILHKFILVKHFPDADILKNVIGYIADDTKTEHLVIETLQKLLSVWADSSAIKHVSYEQHKYVTQAVLICVGHLTKRQLEKHRHDLTLWLTAGMSAHLDSADSKIRRLGMIVGEAISERTDFKGDNKLKFGYEENVETESLLKLLTPEQTPTEEYYQNLLQDYQTLMEDILTKMDKTAADDNNSIRSFTTTKATFLNVISCTHRPSNIEKVEQDEGEKVDGLVASVDLDSDDDDDDDEFKPYDMSNDIVYRKVKTPMYIRDCMDGLMEREDREKMEVCLGTAKSLIQKDPVAAKEISVELCKILLLLDDTFALDDYNSLRMSAMAELVIVDPERVAGYFTHEFYEENYCLQQRLDILDVLTSAASVLSSVERKESGENDDKKILGESPSPADINQSWRDIVDRRIEAKTKRYGKVRKKSLPPKENRFGPVAGCFFYPLLSGYDKRVRTMDLLGTDAIVLGRLLYAVGTIVYSAMNTTAANAMAKSLLEFVLEIRFHSEAYVRQSALFCVSMATISGGKNILGVDVIPEITEWVNEVMSNDTNTRTKHLAAQTAMLMRTCFSKELGLQS